MEERVTIGHGDLTGRRFPDDQLNGKNLASNMAVAFHIKAMDEAVDGLIANLVRWDLNSR